MRVKISVWSLNTACNKQYAINPLRNPLHVPDKTHTSAPGKQSSRSQTLGLNIDEVVLGKHSPSLDLPKPALSLPFLGWMTQSSHTTRVNNPVHLWLSILRLFIFNLWSLCIINKPPCAALKPAQTSWNDIINLHKAWLYFTPDYMLYLETLLNI